MFHPSILSRTSALFGVLIAALSAGCGGGGGGGGDAAPTYTIGGTLSGMRDPSMELQLNGGAIAMTVNANGAFQFPPVADGLVYTVSVKTPPPTQTCTVTDGSGTVAGANVTNVTVSCSPWTKQLGAGGWTEVYASATDASGNVYVVGTTDVALPGAAQSGFNDAFLTKYDRLGTRVYTRQIGAAGANTNGTGIALDGDGNVYVVGDTDGNLNGVSITGSSDAFLIKYDAAGTRLYTQLLGVAGASTWGVAVHADASGKVYVAGSTTGNLDNNSLLGIQDAFVAKYDGATGDRVLTRLMGAVNATTTCQAIAAGADNLYLAGSTSGDLDGANDDLHFTGVDSDLFLAKFDTNATLTPIAEEGALGAYVYGYSLATDAGGNIYVAGYTNGDMGGVGGKVGNLDAFLLKFDATGAKLNARQWGVESADTYARSVVTDANGDIYVAGSTSGALNGNTESGDFDAVLVKFGAGAAPEDAPLYTWQLGAAAATLTEGWSVTVGAEGMVYVGGYTGGDLDGNLFSGDAYDGFLAKLAAVTGAKQ